MYMHCIRDTLTTDYWLILCNERNETKNEFDTWNSKCLLGSDLNLIFSLLSPHSYMWICMMQSQIRVFAIVNDNKNRWNITKSTNEIQFEHCNYTLQTRTKTHFILNSCFTFIIVPSPPPPPLPFIVYLQFDVRFFSFAFRRGFWFYRIKTTMHELNERRKSAHILHWHGTEMRITFRFML